MTKQVALQKGTAVREMFAAIAPRYDATNRILTAGADERAGASAPWRSWPRPAAAASSICAAAQATSRFIWSARDPTLDVTGTDFCDADARRRRERVRSAKIAAAARRSSSGDVMALPFADASFDGATMGFSMRNVVDIVATLREARRVLKPGARFVNLDVSKAPNPLFRRLVRPLLLPARTARRRTRRRIARRLHAICRSRSRIIRMPMAWPRASRRRFYRRAHHPARLRRNRHPRRSRAMIEPRSASERDLYALVEDFFRHRFRPTIR